MAGKSSKGRNKRESQHASSTSEPAVHSDLPVKNNLELVILLVSIQSDLQLYPVSVKTQTGEKLELQLNPGDSVMDVRQFLLDAPENIADITTGGCSLEMVPVVDDMNAQKQKGQALNAASAQKAIDILKLLQLLGSGSSSVSTNKSLNAAIMGEALPRGRGIDERAARATAEVRKKAAARGLQVQLQTLNNGNADGAKEDTNGIDPSDSTDVNKGQTVPVQEQAPVGLGKGLSSLDAKKQNAKPKAGA
ncbi:Clustered mitochondria protein [Vigna angularis]|uniref:Clustered mitochondria protein n=1 Tax=Phaseolus angularis TaxID=3914 RepID=A0A8T0JG97_PHAAN|nr:Clustered mitochondria protein [Vigna angularis]